MAAPATLVDVPNEFQCIITADVMTDPVRTDCPAPDGHIFERLALANWFRTNLELQCPICRRIVTSAVPDEQMAQRIQNEFVRVNDANAQHFARTRQHMLSDPAYAQVRGQPVIPQAPAVRPRRAEEEYPLQDPFLFRIFFEGFPPREPIPVRREPEIPANVFVRGWRYVRNQFQRLSQIIRGIRPHPIALYFQARQLVRDENLLAAEQIADTNPDINLKDISYEEITYGYIRRGRNNFNLNEAERVATKITNTTRKDRLLGSVASACGRNRNYAQSLRVISNITSPLRRVGQFCLLGLTTMINTFGIILSSLGLFLLIRTGLVLTLGVFSLLIFPIRFVLNRLRERA